jgi:hypothetical protein
VERRRLKSWGILALMTVAGCGGSGGAGQAAGWAPTATTNDATTINGGMTGTCNSMLLRKKVPLTLSGGGDQFALGDGYLFTEADIPYYVNFTVPIRNLGSTMHCFVAITGGSYQWNTAAGSAPVALMTPYVTGSVGEVSPSGLYTETCLAPGETGILFDIEMSTDQSDLFTPTTGITMALETSFDGTPPPAALVPQSYMDASGVLTVAFKNVGTGQANIDMMGPYLLLDSGGLPTTFGYLDELPAGLLDAGQSGTATATPNPIDCGVSVRAYIVFDSPTAASAPAGVDSALAAAAQAARAWRSSLGAKVSAIRAAHAMP